MGVQTTEVSANREMLVAAGSRLRILSGNAFRGLPGVNPLDVAESLEKRGGIPHAIGLHDVWLQHVRAAEAELRATGRVLLFGENFLLEPQSTMEPLSGALMPASRRPRVTTAQPLVIALPPLAPPPPQ